MVNKKINSLQLTSILIMLMVSSFNNVENFSLIKSVGIDSYISVILGFLIGILFFRILVYIANYKPDLLINEKITSLFGKRAGQLINYTLALLFIVFGFTSMYNLTNFIGSQFLDQTPFTLIALIFCIVIIYINTKGIETLSRVSLILTAINCCLFLLAVSSLFFQIDYSNFLPVLKDGIDRPIRGINYILSMNIVPMFLLLMVPKNSIVDKNKCNKYLWWGYVFGFIIIFLMIFIIIGNLGIYLTSTYQYPEYIVLKRINYLDFLDRVENIIVIQWFFGLFITLSLDVYFISKTVNKRSKKLLPVISTIIILIFASFLFKNNTDFNYYVYNYLPYLRYIVLVIFVIVFLKIWTQKKHHKDA